MAPWIEAMARWIFGLLAPGLQTLKSFYPAYRIRSMHLPHTPTTRCTESPEAPTGTATTPRIDASHSIEGHHLEERDRDVFRVDSTATYKHSPTQTPIPAHLTLYRDPTYLNLSVPISRLSIRTLRNIIGTLIPIAHLSSDVMSEPPTEMDEALASLESATALSADIVAAKSGDSAARERLVDAGTLSMKFPGNRDRAMGHALVIIEDLEELGISAEREYHGVVLENEAGTLHRIDIHVEGGEQ